LFLPICLLIFILLKNFGYGRHAIVFLGLASLFFYGWWDIRFLGLLFGSVVLNFTLGLFLTRKNGNKPILLLGIAGNLLCLGVFKYFDFFIDNINALLTNDLSVPSFILPLGISFFTFQQIAYLVDAYKGKAQEHRFTDYLLFVTFFPQLIAGPIVHHKEMMPQFKAHAPEPYNWAMGAMGLTVFACGLFKKVVLADELSVHGSPIFQAANIGEVISFTEAWVAALSYTFQLYFDFSGYSDMAIGLGLLFGIKLPKNFQSPYKATSIIDFWKRWHITLSVFLKDYLYVPLGGNRKGKARRYINIMITMVLGGLWHGAGWTFVLWGMLHGFYIVLNHIWRYVFPAWRNYKGLGVKLLGGVVTMLAVIIGWVFFRSESVSAAVSILQGMAGLSGISSDSSSLSDAYGIIIISVLIAFTLPNNAQIMDFAKTKINMKWYSWKLNKSWLMVTIVLLFMPLYLIVYKMNRVSEFIYFQF
jgi:D-alanyl-lipoteichoic acid acyltransferase DltB (MBOAT superfamily)